MTGGLADSVSAAFQALLRAVDAEIECAHSAGTRAFEARAYGAARASLERVGWMHALRQRVADLHAEWQGLTTSPSGDSRCPRPNAAPPRTRLPIGRRTPQSAYRLPLLQVLIELGGRGRSHLVLARLLERMQPLLKGVDYQPLPSNPGLPRWRNTAYWARTLLTKEGLLNPHSSYGVWEITDAGRAYVQRHTGRQAAPSGEAGDACTAGDAAGAG